MILSIFLFRLRFSVITRKTLLLFFGIFYDNFVHAISQKCLNRFQRNSEILLFMFWTLSKFLVDGVAFVFEILTVNWFFEGRFVWNVRRKIVIFFESIHFCLALKAPKLDRAWKLRLKKRCDFIWFS